MSYMKLLSIITLLVLAIGASAQTPAAPVADTPAVKPTEFLPQVLEPTGGKIQRPKDWFYTEDHHGQSYSWLLSPDNPMKGMCTTGVQIQTVIGVKAGTGKNPKDVALEFIARRKKEATKVVKEGEARNQGLFTRVTLETVEGKDHVLYCAFWGNDNLDVVVVSSAGTTGKLWDTYAAAFETMSQFVPIDMDRVDKPASATGVTKEQLIGHWRYADENVSSEYTFKDDGTFTGNIAQHGKVVWETAGKWSIDGATLNYELTSSSKNQVGAGAKDQDRITSITKDYYMIDSGNGGQRKFERVP
jgi:hypothetical protein